MPGENGNKGIGPVSSLPLGVCRQHNVVLGTGGYAAEIGAAARIRGKGLSIPAVEVFVFVARGVNIAGDASAKTGIAAAAGYQIGADGAIALGIIFSQPLTFIQPERPL